MSGIESNIRRPIEILVNALEVLSRPLDMLSALMGVLSVS
jgi:hypothetical protein